MQSIEDANAIAPMRVRIHLGEILFLSRLAVCGLLSVIGHLDGQCLPDDLSLTSAPSGNVTYQATNSITAPTAGSFTVNGNQSIVFQAGNTITLKPGFQATGPSSGSTPSFDASIVPSLYYTLCLETPTSLPTATAGQYYRVLLMPEYLNVVGGYGPFTVYLYSVGPQGLPGMDLYPYSGGYLYGGGLNYVVPPGTTPGTYPFTVQVVDYSGAYSGTVQMSLTIGANVPSVSISTSSLPNGTAGVAYTGAISASGGTAPYNWSISGGYPPPGLSLPAMSIGPNTAMSGTPTTVGTYTFTVKVTDANNQTASRSFTVGIANGLVITPTSISSIEQGVSYSSSNPVATFSAAGGTSPYTYSVPANSLPQGLALSSTSGALTGTPTTAGTVNFTVTATDAHQALGTDNVNLTVVPAVTVSTNSLPSGTSGVAYSASLSTVNGTGAAPYTWSITNGTLPSGLSLSSSGPITGTTNSTGSFPITVQVRDSDGGVASQSFTLVIGLSPPPTVICSYTPNSPYPGQQVNLTASASGVIGTPTYSWSGYSSQIGSSASININAPSQSSFSESVAVTDSSTGLTSSPATCTVTVSLPTVREYIRIGNRIIAIEVHQ